MRRNETVDGVLLSYTSIGISMLSGLLFTPFLLKCLGQNEYGLYELMGGFVAYLSVLDLGLASTITRYISQYNLLGEKEKQENFLAMCTLIYTIITVLILSFGFLFYFLLEDIFGNSLTEIELSKAKTMYLMLMFSMGVTIFGNIFLGVLSGLEKFVVPKLLQIAKVLLNMVWGTVILFKGADSLDITILNVILNLAVFGLMAIYSLKFIKIKFYYWDKSLFKEIFTFAFFVFLQGVMSQLYWKVGQLILGITMNTAAVAIYAVAMVFNCLFLNFSTAIAGVLLPKASRLVINKADGEALTDFMIVTSRYIFAVYGLLTIGFAAFGKEFLRLWAGPAYEQAYYIVLIVVISSLVPRIQASINAIAQAYNKHGFLTTMYFLMGVANVGISIFLVKFMGIVGTAVGTAIALIIGNTIGANIYFSKEFNINVKRCLKDTFSGIALVCMLTLFCGLALNILLGYKGFTIFFVKVSLLIAIYAILMMWIGFNNNEKTLLKSIIGRLFVRRVSNG
jgi:O-antigen/teichoic acid export membrane protein